MVSRERPVVASVIATKPGFQKVGMIGSSGWVLAKRTKTCRTDVKASKLLKDCR